MRSTKVERRRIIKCEIERGTRQIHGYIRERKKGRKNERKGGEKTGSFVTNILI